MVPSATAQLEIQDERFGPQWLSLKTDKTGVTDAGTLKLAAPRVLEGTVVADDTGEPVADAVVPIDAYEIGITGQRGHITARTDAAGRFSVKPYPGGSLGLTVGGAVGTPFLATYREVKWPKDAPKLSVQIRLPRGLLVRGQVVEDGSARPVAGAHIQYRPMSAKNDHGDKGNLLMLWRWLDVASDVDGRFAIAVLPGPGHLLVRGPSHDYLHVEVSERELIYGRKGGGRAHFPDALVPLDLSPDAKPVSVVAGLKRGVTITGKVERADGTAVPSGFLVSKNFLGSGWEEHSEFLPVSAGQFKIPGCDPEAAETFWFWDHKAVQGAIVKLSPKDRDPTVRLAPLGFASFRFVDDKGNVLKKLPIHAYLVTRPGVDQRESWSKDMPLRLTKLASSFQGIGQDPDTGVITARALIPGASYIVNAGIDMITPPFSVPPGVHVRLPDVVVAPPQKPKRP